MVTIAYVAFAVLGEITLGVVNMLFTTSKQYARTLGLELEPEAIAGNVLIGAFEIQTGGQLCDLPGMVNGYWSSWETCREGLHRLESEFTVNSGVAAGF